ncbi:MAG: phosphoribosylanthranilate isomerase [Anaerolineae bacterium]
MVRVKICGLTNLEDARWAWQAGADLLGFIFVPASPRCISPAQAAAIIKALRREGCRALCVGVFADAPASDVEEIADHCKLDLVQLHGAEPPAYAQGLGRPIIRAHRVRGPVPWEELLAYDAWAYLLDSFHPQSAGGTGQRWAWDELDISAVPPARLIIAGGLTPDNVVDAVRRLRPWGVDVSSGVESRPGQKDPVRVRDFILRAKAVRMGG